MRNAHGIDPVALDKYLTTSPDDARYLAEPDESINTPPDDDDHDEEEPMIDNEPFYPLILSWQTRADALFEEVERYVATAPNEVWREDSQERRDLVVVIRHLEAAMVHLRQAGSGFGRAHRVILKVAVKAGLTT